MSDLVPGNVDTHCLAASGTTAAFVTEDGELWRSEDAGASFAPAGKDHRAPRGIALVA